MVFVRQSIRILVFPQQIESGKHSRTPSETDGETANAGPHVDRKRRCRFVTFNPTSWTSALPLVTRQEFVAIGPNPAELANLCRGVDLAHARATHVSNDTQATFREIIQATRGFLPTSFKAVFESGKIVEAAVPEKCMSGQLLQLNACKLVQVLKAWFSGKIHNRRDRSRAKAQQTSQEPPAKKSRPCGKTK